MSVIELTCETTEFVVKPEKANETTAFVISEQCVVITTLNEKGKVLYETEIDIVDARKLAKLILL